MSHQVGFMVYPVKSPTFESDIPLGQLYLEDQPRESLLGSATSGGLNLPLRKMRVRQLGL